MEIDNTKIKSNNLDILLQSLRIIDEHLEKERQRGESAENRANMLITLIGIGATIILALSNNILANKGPVEIIVKFIYVITLLFIFKATFYTLKTFSIRQCKRLTPDMINDIQELEYCKALSYEIKWKIWEYNKFIPVNTEKLFYVARAHRNFMFAIFSVLLLAVVLFLNQNLTLNACWLVCLQITLGIFGVLFVIFFDYIVERFSFWE